MINNRIPYGGIVLKYNCNNIIYMHLDIIQIEKDASNSCTKRSLKQQFFDDRYYKTSPS